MCSLKYTDTEVVLLRFFSTRLKWYYESVNRIIVYMHGKGKRQVPHVNLCCFVRKVLIHANRLANDLTDNNLTESYPSDKFVYRSVLSLFAQRPCQHFAS